MYQEPSSHRIDPVTGDLSASTSCYEKRLTDLEGIYLDSKAFSQALIEHADTIVYRVNERRPQQSAGDLVFGTTYMKPGRVGDEFYVTRGHIHATANRPEVYVGAGGKGLMLMESPEGEVRILELLPHLAVYVPPIWVHRAVNVGAEPLVMSFFYPSDAGQDYGIIERSGGMAVRIVADGNGWKAVPNPTYRTRTAEDVARVMASTDGAFS